MNKNKEKLWVEIKIKKEFSRFGIPEMVGIYYNPYGKTVKEVIKFWVLPEFINQVYGYKIA
jgi:hypothetical protein